MTDAAWRESATCAQTIPDLFFPSKGDSIREAVRICGTCPVRTECLEFAMTYEGTNCQSYRHGVWGGLTPLQRTRLAHAQESAA